MSLSKAQAREILAERGLRTTAPRLAVLLVLANAHSPLSHGDVLERLGETDWDPATVFRNLVKLREAGVAPVVSRAGGIDRYALSTAHSDDHQHPHFACDDCGQLTCLPFNITNTSAVDGPWAASVARAMVQLRGQCPECLPTSVEG